MESHFNFMFLELGEILYPIYPICRSHISYTHTCTYTYTHTYTCILHHLITLTPLKNSPLPETFGFLFIHFQWMGHVIPVPWSDNCRLIASNLARRTSKPCSACGTLPRPGLKQTWDTGKPPRTAQRRYVVVLILISNN